MMAVTHNLPDLAVPLKQSIEEYQDNLDLE